MPEQLKFDLPKWLPVIVVIVSVISALSIGSYKIDQFNHEHQEDSKSVQRKFDDMNGRVDKIEGYTRSNYKSIKELDTNQQLLKKDYDQIKELMSTVNDNLKENNKLLRKVDTTLKVKEELAKIATKT